MSEWRIAYIVSYTCSSDDISEILGCKSVELSFLNSEIPY